MAEQGNLVPLPDNSVEKGDNVKVSPGNEEKSPAVGLPLRTDGKGTSFNEVPAQDQTVTFGLSSPEV